jgi:hypothetical protein
MIQPHGNTLIDRFVTIKTGKRDTGRI